MSQLDFRRETVSDFFDALVDSNLADAGFYITEVGDRVPCRVLLNRGGAPAGTFGTVFGGKNTLRIVSADVPNPVRGSDISVESIAAGIERFTLVEKLDDDGALTTWSVERHYA